ncbi:AMIN domain-containing protein, partial [Nitrospirota bacterium]
MQRALIHIILVIGLIMASGCAKNETVGGVQKDLGLTVINSISFTEEAVVLQMSGEFSQSFTVAKPYDPYTIVIEVPGVHAGDLAEEIKPEVEVLEVVRISTVQTPMLLTRLELVLAKPMDVVPRKDGQFLVLDMLESGAAFEKASARPLELATTVDGADEDEIKLLPATELTAMGFREYDKETRFVAYGDGSLQPVVFTLKGRIIVDIPGVTMNAPLPDKVVAPVKGIRYGKYEDKIRLVLDMDQDRDFLAVTEDNSIIIVIPHRDQNVVEYGESTKDPVLLTNKTIKESEEAPATGQEAAPEADDAIREVAAADIPVEEDIPDVPTPEGPVPYAIGDSDEDKDMAKKSTEDDMFDVEAQYRKKYTGKLISLDFQGADVVPIFRFLSEIGGYNVVIHPAVSGKITLKLTNVPWDHALDIILELSNQGKSIEGNILRIAPPSIFVKQKEDASRLKAATIKAEDLQQIALHLNYISAEEMRDRLLEAKSAQTKDAGAAGTDRSTVRIDARMNTIIINDTPGNIKRIREVEIPYWDTPEHGTMQVLIEAKIVSVRTDYTHTLGISWGGSATNDNFSFINDESSIDFSVNTPVAAAG